MEYSSLLFIYGFLPLSLAVYCISPKKLKEGALLLLSMVFAGLFGLKYLFFLILFTAVNYTAALLTSLLRNKFAQVKAIPFAMGLIFDFSALFSFRTEMFAFLREPLHMPSAFFPAGISLFTLSAAGYLIDVYKGSVQAEKDPVRFALFIMMFPRLIMGPVLGYENYTRIMNGRRFTLSRLGRGLSMFIVGLAKKVMIADALYMLCSAVRSADVSKLSAVTAWMGAIGYLLCLYFTLSGLADMGCGIGCCFGYRFPSSFSYPLFSSRIRYFTSKWHIHTIRWFRKYIIRNFTESVNKRWFGIIMFIFGWILIGIWYGFTVGAALWGALMGIAMTIERRVLNSKMMRSTGIIYTFLATTIMTVFLSQGSISGSLRYIGAMLGGNRVLVDELTVYLLGSYIVLLLIAVYAATDLFRNLIVRVSRTKAGKYVSSASPVVMLVLLALCTAMISYSGVSGDLIIRL